MQRQLAYQYLNYYKNEGKNPPAKFILEVLQSTDRKGIVPNYFVWGEDLIEVYLSLSYTNRFVYSKRRDLVDGTYRSVVSHSFRFDRRCDKKIQELINPPL